MTNNINHIEEVMKKHLEQHKDIQGGSKPADKPKIPSLYDKYAHLLKERKGKGKEDQFSTGSQDNELLLLEFERLKASEQEAREEVLYLENFVRKLRTVQKLKITVLK